MRGIRSGLVALLLLSSMTASAEDRQAAKNAFEEGKKYFDLNDFDHALEAFKRAYWNYPNSTFLYNIAQCHRRLKHYSDAIEFYRSYLHNAPDAPNRPEVQRTISELQDTIAKEQAVATTPPSMPPKENSPPPKEAPTSPPPAPPTARQDLVAQPPPIAERHDPPVWKRGWFWGVMSAVVVVGVGVGVGVGIADSSPIKPLPTLGAIKVN